MGRTRNRLEPGAGAGARTVPRFREGRGGLRCVRYPADRAARRARLTGGPLRVVPRLRDVVELSGHQHEILHRSEEHTSELQSLTNLVCRLLLEKKKKKHKAENKTK